MPDLLSRALRDVVEASSDPVTVDEVVGLPQAVPRNRPRVPLLLAAAVVVVAGLAGGLVLAGRDTDDVDDRSTVASAPETTAAPTTMPEEPTLADCAQPLEGEGGCTADDADASRLLGVPVATPRGIPEGWVLHHHEVRHVTDEPTGPITEYNRSWFRDPSEAHPAFAENTLLECSPGPCDLPDYVQLMVLVGVPEPRDDAAYGVLGALEDGTEVRGFDGDSGVYLSWRRDDVVYRLRTSGLDVEQAFTIAESL